MCEPFNEVQQEVQKYASADLDEWLAHFRQTYFTSPWTILSLLSSSSRRRTLSSPTTKKMEPEPAEYNHWVADITKDYKEYVSLGIRGGTRPDKCIFKWPHDLVKLLGEGIHREPQMVAIGPYHHGRKHLQPMEDHKRKSLFRVLSLNPELEVSNFVEALKQREQELRDRYDELDTGNWPSDSFIKMMLLDGCFLLDLLWGLDTVVEPPLDQSICKQLYNTYAEAVLTGDIYLLENQIPGLVLDVLIDVGDYEYSPDLKRPLFSEALHLLDYGRSVCALSGTGPVSRCCWPERQESASGQSVDRPSTGFKDLARLKKEKFVRSARKLRAAGVTFKKIEEDNSTGMLGLSFSGGVLSLPVLVLDEKVEGMLTNMVAFERMYPQSGSGVSSFLSFMDALIDTAEDVSFLGKEGILKNRLGSDEAAAKIFNKLGIHEMCDPFDKVQREVLDYASSNLHEWLAYLRQTYFTNPWTILSLIGALLLIFLSIVQTTYTVLPYYRKNGA
ncbi:UPF0481 protein [Nymphaea thermarum]|nr:UPF0481 protein [Nymphaea thermarum]